MCRFNSLSPQSNQGSWDRLICGECHSLSWILTLSKTPRLKSDSTEHLQGSASLFQAVPQPTPPWLKLSNLMIYKRCASHFTYQAPDTFPHKFNFLASQPHIHPRPLTPEPSHPSHTPTELTPLAPAPSIFSCCSAIPRNDSSGVRDFFSVFFLSWSVRCSVRVFVTNSTLVAENT